MKRTHSIIFWGYLFSVFLFWGCNTALPKSEISNEIIRHFESRHYRVIDIDIGAIESIPQGEKIYMGTEGYVVRIKSITLEATRQNAQFTFSRGQRLIYKDGSISIKRSTDTLRQWIITDIANIPVP